MFVCNRGDTVKCHGGGLRTRELGQSPTIKLFSILIFVGHSTYIADFLPRRQNWFWLNKPYAYFLFTYVWVLIGIGNTLLSGNTWHLNRKERPKFYYCFWPRASPRGLKSYYVVSPFTDALLNFFGGGRGMIYMQYGPLDQKEKNDFLKMLEKSSINRGWIIIIWTGVLAIFV